MDSKTQEMILDGKICQYCQALLDPDGAGIPQVCDDCFEERKLEEDNMETRTEEQIWESLKQNTAEVVGLLRKSAQLDREILEILNKPIDISAPCQRVQDL